MKNIKLRLIVILNIISYFCLAGEIQSDITLENQFIDREVKTYKVMYSIQFNDKKGSNLLGFEQGVLTEKTVMLQQFTDLEYKYTPGKIFLFKEEYPAKNDPIYSSFRLNRKQELYSCNNIVDPSAYLMQVVAEGAANHKIGVDLPKLLADERSGKLKDTKIFKLPKVKEWDSALLWDLRLIDYKNKSKIGLQPSREQKLHYSASELEFRYGAFIAYADWNVKGSLWSKLTGSKGPYGQIQYELTKGRIVVLGGTFYYPDLLRGVQLSTLFYNSAQSKKYDKSSIKTVLTISLTEQLD